MNKFTSFLSEHSVGLTIVPILQNILLGHYSFVVPLFPWFTREGGTMARLLHPNVKFKLLALYPRRPKFSMREESSIYIKINYKLILASNLANNLGIPVIAGMPLVKNFWQLSGNPKCLWTRLNFEKTEDYNFQLEFPNYTVSDKALASRTFSDHQAILNYIDEVAKKHDYKNALMVMKQIKMESGGMSSFPRFFFHAGYKPIYFLLK